MLQPNFESYDPIKQKLYSA